MSGGVDQVATELALWTWVVRGTGLPEDKVLWGDQDTARPPGPAVIMRISNIADVGRPWLDVDSNPLSFDPLVATAVSAGGDTITLPAHGRTTGDGPVRAVTDGVFPGGLDSGIDYWLIVVDPNTVKLATSFARAGGTGGSGGLATPVDLTSAGSGTLSVVSTADTVSAGAENLAIARSLQRWTLEIRCHSADGVGVDQAVAILNRLRARSVLPSQFQLLEDANIGLIDADRVRALLGTRDATLFEPRAMMDAHFQVACEETEPVTVVEVVDLTDQSTDRVFVVS